MYLSRKCLTDWLLKIKCYCLHTGVSNVAMRLHEIYVSWLGWNTVEAEEAVTEQSVVPVSCSVTLQPRIFLRWSQLPVCLSFAAIWCLFQWYFQLPIFHAEGHSSAAI